MCDFAKFAVWFAFLACAQVASATDQDFNGRWDLIVHNNPTCTVTCAWWLEVTAAGTPAQKVMWVGFSDGSLHELPDVTIKDGVLHFAYDRPAGGGRGPAPGNAAAGGAAPGGAAAARAGAASKGPSPAQHVDYEIRYVNGKLEGRMIGGKNLTFTGERARRTRTICLPGPAAAACLRLRSNRMSSALWRFSPLLVNRSHSRN